jgi:hypothetical protein
MKSRLTFNTPLGPMCYIDYDTVQRGKSTFEQLRRVGGFLPNSRSYEFSLFEKIKNKLVKTDRFYLPTFNVPCVNIFLDSADAEPVKV